MLWSVSSGVLRIVFLKQETAYELRMSDWSSDVCSSDLDTGRAGHLIATHAGKPDTKRLLLIAHLDTVFEPDSPFQRFERMGDKAKGPGAGDDKGGMVVAVAALRAIDRKSVV